MAESGRKTYRATADCTAGRITAVDEKQYTLGGVWDNSDIGAGRTKWRGADGQIIGRDNASGGLAISQQWELLCPGPVSPALLSQAAVPSARSTPATVPICAGKRFCEETDSFGVIVRDFRPSTISGSVRVVSATLKFLNKTNRPLILGYVRSAGVAVDERGNRYTLASAESVRGMGEITGREFDPKFTLAPGQTADTRFEFIWQWNGRDILGMKAWDVEVAVRSVTEVAPGQYRFGAEHALQFRGVPPAAVISSESLAPSQAPPDAGGTATAEPVPEVRATDACVGRPRCFSSGSFVAEIQHAALTHEGAYKDRVARLNVAIRNTTQRPLSLAYVAKSSVLTDNLGNRFFWGTAGTYDTSATGIGKVEGNRVDPQMTLAPGESRVATFTLRRRTPRTDPDGAAYTYNVTVAELQVINSQQVRTSREHSIMFADFALTSSAVGSAAAPPQSAAPVQSTEQNIKKLSDAIRGLGSKKR
ncbi:MAG TPA: hypothetical protein VER03_02030 [Bryobacteraceae bacterium]|nr:hypothetical protein [Bryobacteraceae bacterium]